MDDLREYLFGKDIKEKEKVFEQKLLQVEEKHISFFKDRNNKIDPNDHDRLANHWKIVKSGGYMRFGFSDNEVPENIQDDCLRIFDEVFNKKTEK